MTHATVAVIGHVDHGKTSLVKALTGVDTDTLQEEKQRGLSITLGFAHLAHGSGQIHLIDTPGHADFIRMTASGISGADAVLLVISAMDGVQPQTLEHIRLAQYFGIRNVTVALTKSDLSQARNVDAVQAEIESILDAHAFTHVAIAACSSAAGAGLGNVADALSSAFEHKRQRPDLKGFFLPIDRVFSTPGAGTIVTGTLLGAGVTVGDNVVLEPKHLAATIRGIQIAGRSQDQAEPGARAALNLRGIDAGALRKGDVLCAPGAFQTGLRFDVSLRPCSDLKHMEQVKVLLGTGHCAARLRLYPSQSDQSVYGQLEFKAPQIAHPGQAFVLRRPASAQLVTGGVVIDPDAVLMTRNKGAHVNMLNACGMHDLNATAHALAARDQGVVDLRTLARISAGDENSLGEDFEMVSSQHALRRIEILALETKIIDALTELHAAHRCRPLIDREDLFRSLRPAPSILIEAAINRNSATQRIHVDRTGVALANRDPFDSMTTDQRAAYQAADDRLKEMELRPVALFQSSGPEQLDLQELLIWKSRAVRLYNHSLKQTLLLSTDAIAAAEQTLRTAFPDAKTFTTGAARDALKTNRKTIVPLLEYFDARGVTEREGDVRIVNGTTPAAAT